MHEISVYTGSTPLRIVIDSEIGKKYSHSPIKLEALFACLIFMLWFRLAPFPLPSNIVSY